MAEPGGNPSIDRRAEDAAREMGRSVLGRELTDGEFEAMAIIFRAAAEALREGFIARLAAHVQAERGEETAEEFFGENLNLG